MSVVILVKEVCDKSEDNLMMLAIRFNDLLSQLTAAQTNSPKRRNMEASREAIMLTEYLVDQMLVEFCEKFVSERSKGLLEVFKSGKKNVIGEEATSGMSV